MKKSFFYSFLATIAMATIYSCGGSKEIADITPVANDNSTFGLIQSKIITPSCATTGCHASKSDNSFKQHGLVLAIGESYKNLVGVDCQNTNARADGYKLVKAFKSAESLFFHKLNWDNSHHNNKNYGSPMPLGGSSLYVGQIEFIRRWIEAGAPEKGSVADVALLDDKTVPTTTTPFTALPTPKEEGLAGFQMRVEPFTIAPNFERELFINKPLDNTTEVYVTRMKLRSRANSHHLVLYDFLDKTKMPALNEIRDLRNPDNTMNIKTMAQLSNHLFLGGGSDPNSEYSFPEGVALAMPVNASVDVNLHYFNKTDKPITGENYVNFYTTDKSKITNFAQKVHMTNRNLNLPPKQRTTQTYTGKFETDVKVFMLTSHMHALGEKFIIKIAGGVRDGETVYETTDWEHPLMKNFDKPIILKKGEGLTSIVTYNNTTDKTVKFGLTSEDEMAIIFGYYYE